MDCVPILGGQSGKKRRRCSSAPVRSRALEGLAGGQSGRASSGTASAQMHACIHARILFTCSTSLVSTSWCGVRLSENFDSFFLTSDVGKQLIMPTMLRFIALNEYHATLWKWMISHVQDGTGEDYENRVASMQDGR